jgi:hypothetical protein
MKDLLEKIVLNSINTLKDEMVNVLQEAGKSLQTSQIAARDGTNSLHHQDQLQLQEQPQRSTIDVGEKSDEGCNAAGDNTNEPNDHLWGESSSSISTIAGKTGDVERIVLTVKPQPQQEKSYPKPKKDSNAESAGDGGNMNDASKDSSAAGGSGSGGTFVNPNAIPTINAYGRNKRLNIMVVGAAAGLIICMLMLSLYQGELPGEVVGIISTVSGIFGSCLKDAYSFEFGSSRGSKDKDEKISSGILAKLNTK